MYRNPLNLRTVQTNSVSQQMQPVQTGLIQGTQNSSPADSAGNVKPVILDSSSAIKLSMGSSMYHERALMARNDIWHRILILRGGQYDKEFVLKSILKAVYPADLIPVKYQIIDNDSCFIARNCDRALDQLCKTNLIVQCLDGSPLILSITLAFASIHDLKINIQPLLLQVLKKKYSSEKKTLNLDNFHKDSDIYKTVYCPLSQARTLAHVLKLAKSALTNIEHISLQNNELTSLEVLESAGFKLKGLDLRHNVLLQIESLEHIKPLNLTELSLDGNPLCENYSNPSQYIEAVREYCPSLRKLDGIQVNVVGLPLLFKSYVKNWKRRKLVEQFVHHFFTAYDHRDRYVLRGLYDEKAWYSTTVGTPTSPTSKKFLEPFGQENRNLLIFGKNSQQLLHHGQEEILKIIKKLPATQHIIKSFCCDLIYDNNYGVAITVEGLFKLTNVKSQIFSFNRTFILSTEDECEFKIINDQYHVYLPIHGIDYIIYNIENENYFETEKLPFEPSCYSPFEKEDIIASLHETTTMTLEYCEKYLKSNYWDIKLALTSFMNHYKSGQLPKEAFS